MNFESNMSVASLIFRDSSGCSSWTFTGIIHKFDMD
jgi:hypothetical protein